MAGIASTVAGSALVPLQESSGALFGGLALLLFFGLPLAFALVVIAGQWKIFEKAGQPGWAAIIPIYNTWVLVVEVADRDALWFILSIFVPFAIVVPMIDVAENFGKGTGYGLGLAFLPFIFYPLLGFSDARYQGRAA